MDSLGCVWRIRAGIIPDVEDSKLSKDFNLNCEERKDFNYFVARQAEVTIYINFLQRMCQQGKICNWVKTEFIWL